MKTRFSVGANNAADPKEGQSHRQALRSSAQMIEPVQKSPAHNRQSLDDTMNYDSVGPSMGASPTQKKPPVYQSPAIIKTSAFNPETMNSLKATPSK